MYHPMQMETVLGFSAGRGARYLCTPPGNLRTPSLVRVRCAGRNNIDICSAPDCVHWHGTVSLQKPGISLAFYERQLQVFSVDDYLIDNNMFTDGHHLFLYWSLVLSIVVATTLWLASCFTEVHCTQAQVSQFGSHFLSVQAYEMYFTLRLRSAGLLRRPGDSTASVVQSSWLKRTKSGKDLTRPHEHSGDHLEPELGAYHASHGSLVKLVFEVAVGVQCTQGALQPTSQTQMARNTRVLISSTKRQNVSIFAT
jgi:hypothetical protein